MASNADVKGGSVTAAGVSKIDDIIVTGFLLTGFSDQKQVIALNSFPNPSLASFSIAMAKETTIIEIYNSKGQLVYKAIPENEILPVEKTFPSGMYFIKASQDGKVSVIKHLVK